MRNILLLGITSLLADFSSEMIQPLLPFFILALGGTGLAIGLISGIGDALAAIFKIISGRWADRTKRFKFFIYFGYLFSALAKFLFPTAQTWNQLLVFRPLERVGKGLRDAPRDAILSESIEHTKRGIGFGIQRALDSLGAILGSIFLLGLFLFFKLDFRTIFLIAAAVALLAVIPIYFVREPAHLTRSTSSELIVSRAELLKIKGEKISFGRLNKTLKKFILIATIFSLANFSYMFFILKAQSNLTINTSNVLVTVILLYIFFNIFDTLFSAPAGFISDRIGRRKTLIVGYLLFAVTSLGFIFAKSFFLFLLLFALYGIFKAIIDGVSKAFVSDMSEVSIRGTALGTYEVFTGLAAIPAGLAAGYLWNLDPNYTFFYGVGLAFIAVILLAKVVKN